MVSQAWKALPDDKRLEWEEMERNDKSARYYCERGRSRNISLYPSSWKIPATKKWMPIHHIMDPKAPKRPMSAFKSFMKSKRAYFRDKNIDDNNKNDDDDVVEEVSNRIIAQMWKDADLEEKKIFLEREFRLRQEYNIVMTDWTKQRIQTTAEEQETERKRRRMRK